MAQKGYAGNILRVDLSTGTITKTPTDNYNTDLFLGGRGLASRMYWEDVPPSCDAFDSKNNLIFITGPICGVPGFAGSRWQACGKSPIPNQFSYANLGGSWGAQLKFSGYDGLVVEGRADKLVYLWITNDSVEIKDASHLRGMGAITTREKLKEELGKSARVVAVGAAGENRIVFATLLADNDSSGSSGLGAVMGSKNLKAVAVRGQAKTEVASEEKVAELRERVRELNAMKHGLIPDMIVTADKTKLTKDICYGCVSGCIRASYESPSGKKGKYFCQPSYFYQTRAQRYYAGQVNDVPFEAAKLCDDYGMDTRAIETMIMWLSRCDKAGILTEAQTGIPFSKIGSLEYIETLVRKIALREGFGDVLANSTFKAAETVGQGSDKFITDYMTRYGENAVYGPRLYLTTGILYAMEPRMPIQQLHEISAQGIMWALNQMGLPGMYLSSDVWRTIAKRFWGSEIAADFSTIEGKALAAAKIQDRQYAKECLILCDLSWPIIHTPVTEDHVGDPTLESQICAAVTGKDIDETGLYKIGERVFNLQRAILAREGHKGRDKDYLQEFEYTVPLKGDFGNAECLVPGKDGKPLARKGMVFSQQDFERMKDEYYEIRGWDTRSGLQRQTQLEELALGDVALALKDEGLLA